MECVGLLALVFAVLTIQRWRATRRRAALMARYGDADIVDAILARKVWQGQTPEQLVDSIGRPVEVDQKVLKTKVKETYKYDQNGKNRFAFRVFLENGHVVGWESK